MHNFLISFLISIILLQGSAFAAFKSEKIPESLDAACNPKAMKDDYVLPMPCDLSMPMRMVIVPRGKKLLEDRSFYMGIANTANDPTATPLYVSRFTGHISASLSKDHLPLLWQQTYAATSQSQDDVFYFIGKYEVNKRQWQAVMNAVNNKGEENKSLCPGRLEKGDNLPVSDISWFDVQEFFRKYNAWIIKYARRDIPSFNEGKVSTYLRLPTEEEWEYAARGGSKVPPEWWENKDFFPIESIKRLDDYGFFSDGPARYSSFAPIGSRNPNPLGIFDTMGNASEMVDSYFRMPVTDVKDGKIEKRLHGYAGGIIIKGGSFFNDKTYVRPGMRDEMPLYSVTGPGSRSDVGFRIALASLAFPDYSQVKEMIKEAKESRQLPQRKDEVNLESATPLEAISILSKNADETMQRGLQKLKTKIEEKEIAQILFNSKRIEHTYRSLLYQAETLRAFAYRYSAVSKEMEKINSFLKNKLSSEDEMKAKKLQAKATQDLKDYFQSLEMGANYYKTSLGVLLDEQEKVLARLTTQAKQEYSGSGVFNEHMRQNIDILNDNIKNARTFGLSSLMPETILKEILPEKHFDLLPLGTKK